MRSKSLIAYMSFGKKNLDRYSITSIIIKAFVAAFCLSAFIYLDAFGVTNYILHSALALCGFWLLFRQNRLGFFFTGFFIGIFWFYWIALSFRYYGNMSWMIPIVILSVALIYGALFAIAGSLSNSPYIRAFALLLLSQIPPFGFNWFDFALILYHTPFGLSLLQVAFLFMAILVAQNLHKKNSILIAALFLAASLDYSNPPQAPKIPFEVEFVQTKISQEHKWENDLIASHIKQNFADIERAIEQKKRLIVFPESAFELYLNRNEAVVDALKKYSQHIAIIGGALTYDNDHYYNSAYLFDKGEMKRADKVVLVPFSERVPLPRFMADIINNIFFDGASDFEEAAEATDFEIDGVKIRSAVCFEGSTNAIHKNSPQIISVISNNAWFTPSIEPTLQNLMLALYATKSSSTVYHTVNGQGGGVIEPRVSLIRQILGR